MTRQSSSNFVPVLREGSLKLVDIKTDTRWVVEVLLYLQQVIKVHYTSTNTSYTNELYNHTKPK